MRFVDTNVLLYAACGTPGNIEKRFRALELLAGSDLALSVQVLQEFYHQATRRSREGRLSPQQALTFLEPLRLFPMQDMTPDVFDAAVVISQRFGLSYWDSAILAAARCLGCEAVYSEDMSSGQDYDGILVINPFARQEQSV